MKRFTANPMTILEYDWWWGKRVNNNITVSSQENTRPIEEHLQVIPSKLETIKQDFEKRSLELGKMIEQLKEEKMHLGLDIDVQKLEAEKMRKGKNKAEEDLDSLKIDYKKLPLSIRTIGLDALERSLLEGQNENVGLKAWVAKLERLINQYRSHNSAIELKEILNKIEELKEKIEEIETALQNCKLRVEIFETNNEQWKEQLQCSQSLIRDRDHIMGKAIT
ncbi:hypothetical protein Goari_010349 [Gossypium aridum]|uniref:Uncharacterized protein n=1 Tax=Gossypium aridum TaxID=34290 RepID=A0A7J8XZU3_GOSAI|nr:hypothetical protein [Gossypium aridum]